MNHRMRVRRGCVAVFAGWISTITLGCIAPNVARPPTKHVVWIAGDEEYRSEESLPELARIVERLPGVRCTVLHSRDPISGAIDPNASHSIPGLEALESADLVVLLIRFRDLPDADMRHFVDYVERGQPIVALRTSTHAFRIGTDRKYSRYSFDATDEIAPGWDGGFGRKILGETWIAHHGEHGVEGTRGRLPAEVDPARAHPILRGIADGAIFDPSDVYSVRLPLPEGCTPIVFGEVTATLSPDASATSERAKNDPMMPIAWTRVLHSAHGQQRIFTTTLGSSQAFLHEASRRLLVNACLWALGREDEITPALDVSLTGNYRPTAFGFRAR